MQVPEKTEIYTVADLDRRLKRAVEGAATDVWVEGEVVSVNAAPSGHVYFSFKDQREDAALDCVMYRSAAQRWHRLILDGAHLQLRGRATVWAPRGRLQFVAEQARPLGRGALLVALENLKNKLFSEGLFAPERKKPVPRDAAVVGVVSSASGAVIHDIAKVAFRRGAVRILLSPSLVQGSGAAEQLIEALDRLERVSCVEVVIIARGGGSFEDLMVFNDEAVVRRVAACRVPIVSAVGHEVDITLTDLAADARAATPSQAAEMVVADAGQMRSALHSARHDLSRVMRGRLAEDVAALSALTSSLRQFASSVAPRRQRVDELWSRLVLAPKRPTAARRAELERLRRRLLARHPRTVAANAQVEVGALFARLVLAARSRIERESLGRAPLIGRLERGARTCLGRARGTLVQNAARLHALSPLAVLGRGYAIATTQDGRAILSAGEVTAGQSISVRVHRGAFRARVEECDSEPVSGDPEAQPEVNAT